MADDPRTSLILPAYVPNEELLETTRKCLASLRKFTDRESYQLVIVENGSYSEALRMACSDARGDVYIGLKDPVGYARAANIGLAVAEHEWLVVLNTDIEFTQPDWLEKLRADYLTTEGGVLSTMDVESLRDPPKRAKKWGSIYYDWSWFSCWLTHRNVIQDVGYFDESMGFRFHDQDYAIRVTRAGYRVMRDANVVVSHVDSATYDAMGRKDLDEKERLERRWGAAGFTDWLMRGQPAPT